MSAKSKAESVADLLQSAVCTYPQMSEDEPGGYCSMQDQLMDEAAAELRRLAAECEALRADAGRYRWLRDKADFLRLPEGSPQVCITDPWGLLVSVARDTYPTGQRLDAAIDAAMKEVGK